MASSEIRAPDYERKICRLQIHRFCMIKSVSNPSDISTRAHQHPPGSSIGQAFPQACSWYSRETMSPSVPCSGWNDDHDELDVFCTDLEHVCRSSRGHTCWLPDPSDLPRCVEGWFPKKPSLAKTMATGDKHYYYCCPEPVENLSGTMALVGWLFSVLCLFWFALLGKLVWDERAIRQDVSGTTPGTTMSGAQRPPAGAGFDSAQDHRVAAAAPSTPKAALWRLTRARCFLIFSFSVLSIFGPLCFLGPISWGQLRRSEEWSGDETEIEWFHHRMEDVGPSVAALYEPIRFFDRLYATVHQTDHDLFLLGDG